MELTALELIGIGLAAMFFGYGFGLFEGRGQGYKRRRGEEEAEKKSGASEPASPPPVVQPAQRGKDLLRLSLDEKEQPRLDLDGQGVGTAPLSPQQRKRLIDLLVTIRPWVEGGAQPTSAPAPMPAARVTSVSAPSISQPRPPAAVPASQPPAKPAGAPLTMVEQIDDILQKKLAGTPLAERGVRLMESDKGGVAVFVGLDRYAGVGEVADPEVQALIRAAIAEWEKKYTPG